MEGATIKPLEYVMQKRFAVCCACEQFINDARGPQCAVMMSDCEGPACVRKLEDAIRRGICPLGKFDAVNMEARL